MAISVSEAGCSFFQRASIAANFAGWCFSTYSPVRWPKKSWTGMITATNAEAPVQHHARFGAMDAAQYVPRTASSYAHPRGEEGGQ